MIQVHLFISGRVQGVGFRFFVEDTANEYGLKGWVRNLSDGRVEAVFQGPRNHIEKVIMLCRKGPSFSEVKGVQVIWEDVRTSYTDFEIL